jgi:hypothetical protein
LSTSNCQFCLFSKKNPSIRIFYISGWLAISINADKWSSAVYKIWRVLLGRENLSLAVGEEHQLGAIENRELFFLYSFQKITQ